MAPTMLPALKMPIARVRSAGAKSRVAVFTPPEKFPHSPVPIQYRINPNWVPVRAKTWAAVAEDHHMTAKESPQPRAPSVHQVTHGELAGHHAELQRGHDAAVRDVRQVEGGADDRRQDGQRLPVDEVDDRDREEQSEDPPASTMDRPFHNEAGCFSMLLHRL